MSSSSPPADAVTTHGHRGAWAAAFAVTAGLLVARNLIGLDTAPVGAYVDETSIGYNAWTVAHSGVDEHGAHLPLYFTAFGEYKNPLYIYALAALLRVVPLTVTTERLPAALFGLMACLFLTLLAWHRTRSRAVTLVVLGLCALTPWLTIESRVGFEVVSMLATISCALWCLSVAMHRGSWRWYAVAGGALALAVFAYSTGRVEVALFTGALALVLGPGARRPHRRAWLATCVPVGIAYAVLAWWNVAHPGALTARFSVISIGADGAGPLVMAGRLVGNYLAYFSPQFLFASGDANPRHASGFGGMILWVSGPLLVCGTVSMWRRRGEPWVRVLALFTLLAPISAALTNEGVPHSLRASVMLPMLTAVTIEGLSMLWQWPWRRLGFGGVALAMLAQGALFTVDMYGAWPTRSAIAFDAGEIEAIRHARVLAGGTPVLLSRTLDPPYISAAFDVIPPPPRAFTADSQTALLAEMNMRLVDGAEATGPSGAIVVLSVFDPAPGGADLLFTETTPAPSAWFGMPPPRYASVLVYRLR